MRSAARISIVGPVNPSRTRSPTLSVDDRSPSLHLEPEPLFADLELDHRLDRDLRHPQPEPVLCLVVLRVPSPLGTTIEADVPRLTERIVGPADGTLRVGPDPVLGL